MQSPHIAPNSQISLPNDVFSFISCVTHGDVHNTMGDQKARKVMGMISYFHFFFLEEIGKVEEAAS